MKVRHWLGVILLGVVMALGTACGSSDDKTDTGGMTDTGGTDEGQGDLGITDEGQEDPGITDEGQEDPGTTDEGQEDPGTTDEAPVDQGTTDEGQEDTGGEPTPEETFPTSLHATAVGMKTVYEDGYKELTDVEYDHPNMGCKDCHDKANNDVLPRSCESCHITEGEAVASSTCFGCHSRQGKMINAIGTYSDVHRDAGKECADCHSLHEMHGDGTAYTSMWDEGAMDTTCEKCHADVDIATHDTAHQGKLDCTACHVQSVVSCYNCHFDTQIEHGEKFAHSAMHDWVFLLNRDGKVRSGTFQSLVYQGGNRYVRWAPFSSHTVSLEARACGDCHDNEAVQQYEADGSIKVTWWDDEAAENNLKHATGIIPVVAGKMMFQFMDFDYDTKTWSKMAGDDDVKLPDMEKFWASEGLTDAQMLKLGMSMGQ